MIVDASVVVAGVLADQRHDEWALEVLLRGRLAAPHLMPMEFTQKPDSPTCAKQAIEFIRPLVTW